LVLEIGQLKDRVADRERERDHANLVADSALRENKSLVERVKRLVDAGDKLRAAFEKEWLTDGDIEAIQDDWEKAKETNP
jgi:hypothetical protein